MLHKRYKRSKKVNDFIHQIINPREIEAPTQLINNNLNYKTFCLKNPHTINK